MNSILAKFKVRFLIPLILVGFAFINIANVVFIELPTILDNFRDNAKKELLGSMNRLQGTFNRFFRLQNFEAIRQEVSFLNCERGIELILLLDEYAKPIASNRYEFIHRFPKNALSPMEWKLVKEATQKMKGVYNINEEKYVITAIFPLNIDIKHQLIPNRVGTFIVKYNYGFEYREVKQIVYTQLLIQILFLSLISILLWLFFKSNLTEPINNLIGASKEFAKGKYNIQVVPKGINELQILTKAFNDMAKEVLKTHTTLKEKEEYLKDILNSQPNIVIVNNGEYLINTNRAFFQFFDEYKSIEEFRKEHKCICEFFESGEKDEFLQAKINDKSWIEVIKENPMKTHKVKINRKDKFYIFAVKLEDVYLKKEHENIVTFSDITELENYKNSLEKRVEEEVEKQRNQEEQLLQQAKLVQMGEMVTNISHHWRQPLNFIGLNIQDILDAYDFGELNRDYLKENIDQTMDALTKMSKTIDNFRDYLVEKPHLENFELSSIISKTLILIGPSLESHYIQVKINFKEKLYAFGDATKLTQALHNILLNSQEAFIERKINKRVINILLDKDSSSWSQIVISDNAGGIKENTLKRIFEPFFTTKEVAFKTGTGLYFAKMFIEGELHGTLKVDNIKNGVKFIIKLPPYKYI